MRAREGLIGAKELRIGEVAERAGVGVETVRFYERRGLLDEPPRSASGYRQYPAETVSKLRFIKRAKDLGFSLSEVNDLITLRLDSAVSAGEIKSRAKAKITHIEEKLRDLERVRDALLHLVQTCDGTSSTTGCPILIALDSEEEK